MPDPVSNLLILLSTRFHRAGSPTFSRLQKLEKKRGPSVKVLDDVLISR
jgi:hypothetical protein